MLALIAPHKKFKQIKSGQSSLHTHSHLRNEKTKIKHTNKCKLTVEKWWILINGFIHLTLLYALVSRIQLTLQIHYFSVAAIAHSIIVNAKLVDYQRQQQKTNRTLSDQHTKCTTFLKTEKNEREKKTKLFTHWKQKENK